MTPVYLGVMVHCQTRKRNQLGLSVSYDRVLAISTSVANRLTEQYEEQGIVCPPAFQKRLYTTAAVDNIDHNPSVTTAKGSFHGTGISLFLFQSSQSTGESSIVSVFDDTANQPLTVKPLPESFSNVPPAGLIFKEPALPDMSCNALQDINNKEEPMKEFCWLRHVHGKVDCTFDGSLNTSWSFLGMLITSQRKPYHQL